MSPQPTVRPARWLLPPEYEQAARLAAELKIGAPAARILAHRGFTDADTARRFLRPSIADLPDPFHLAGMEEAAERLRRAIERREPVLLYGDYDVDGTSSVVILSKAIELAGGVSMFHVPHRLRDGYGMRVDVIERAARENVKLIVSVDTGIRAIEVVKRARELGIDVIVTDHHLPEDELPPALAVLNPNRPDCPYPDKNLCGAGVTFKLVQALMRKLAWPAEKVRRLEESFLKIVALATVADVVPLTGENRIIVKHGLAGFRNLKNIGLRALMAVSGFAAGDAPSAGQVAFRVAPRINAAGRMDDASDVIRLFLTSDPNEAREIAGRLHGLNRERQDTEAEIIARILEECETAPVLDDQAALVFCGEGWHRGVLGIVASRLVERFCRPVLVLGLEDGQASGSGRSVAGFHLLDALDSMSDLFLRYGGHKMAAGVTLDVARLPEFRERLNAWAASRLSPEDFCPRIDIDGVIRMDEIHDRNVHDILALSPFGAGNPTPQLALFDVEVAGDPSLFKDKHLKVRLRGAGRFLIAKAWNFVGRMGELRNGSRVDVVISFEERFSDWSVQLRDVRPAR